MENFSKIARKNMLARHNDLRPVVGSNRYTLMEARYPGYYSGYRVTDCLTFVWRVISESYVEVGRPDIPKALIKYAKVRRWGRSSEDMYGDLLAKALVDHYGWKAIYLTPDSVHPDDGDAEHSRNAKSVMDNCTRLNIPVSYYAFNYHPTNKTNINFGKVNPVTKETQFNEAGFNALLNIPFAYGFSSEGRHTWLFSEAKVFEVHWDEEGPFVHEVRWVSGFDWNSNLIVVPPDASKSLKSSGLKKC